MRQILENNILKVEIDSKGAELQSIINVRTGHQYMWQGDPRFWNRRSPVLFPVVGSCWDAQYRMDGKVYDMNQHGFVRDEEFEIVDGTPDNEAWFRLVSDDRYLDRYPRRFTIEIGYLLDGDRLKVMWKVINNDIREMSFQIGAHPAFNYPEFNPADEVHGYLAFDRKPVDTHLLATKGCFAPDYQPVVTDDHDMIPIVDGVFDIDTIVLEKRQVGRVSLLSKERMPYVSVLFNAPLVGVWSPGHDCPFVCIEPWWGRADDAGFTGEFRDRPYANTIQAGETFNADYLIVFES